MDEILEAEPRARDSVHHLQLARAARLKAVATKDLDLSVRLREAAVLHERKRGNSSASKRMPRRRTKADL